MARITITDSLSVEVLSAHPQTNSGLARYLRGAAAELLAGAEFVRQFRRELTLVNPGQGGFTLQWRGDVPLGAGAPALEVSAGSTALIEVHNRVGMLLVDDAFVGPALKVPAGKAFVSLLIRPTVAAGVSFQAASLSFGLDVTSEMEWRFYGPFDLLAGSDPGHTLTLGDACRQLLETLTIPNRADDLKTMAARPDGTMATVTGRGQLRIRCSANVAAVLNPLASIDTIERLGPLSVAGRASATVGVKATISGDFQIRVQTTAPGIVRLGYHTMAARDVSVTIDAAAGPGVTLGDRDLLQMLFGGPTSPGRTTEETLTAAGVSDTQLKRITTAMKAGLSRRLQLEVSAGFSSLRQSDAAFLYEIDVAALDDTGSRAIDKALAGDLSDLTMLEESLPAHGITLIQSRTDQLRKREVKWRLNIVGLVNVLSVSELAVKASIVHDEESGELLMTDAATGRKVKAITNRRDLRRLLFESLMLTVTYKASGLDSNTGVTAAHSYFTMDKDVNRHEMADYLDAVAAVGLLPSGEIDGHLGQIDDFDRGSLLIDVEFDQAACERMFLDDQGAPRDRDFYEDVGKLALLALVQADDADAYRRVPLENGTLWQRMRNGESSDFRTLLPPPVTSGTDDARKLHVAVVTADYMTIVWWADTMATAARKLAAMRAFLAGPPPVVPSDTDKAFTDRRKDLSRAMVKVVQKSPSTFGGDPWGLVALFYASRRSASVTAAVVSPRLTLFLP